MRTRTKVEKITPQKALKWLKQYKDKSSNPIAKQRLDYCINKLRCVASPSETPFIEAIAFDVKGKLIHGKTRLTACVRTGTEFKSAVMYNTDKNTLVSNGIILTEYEKPGIHIEGEAPVFQIPNFYEVPRIKKVIVKHEEEAPVFEIPNFSEDRLNSEQIDAILKAKGLKPRLEEPIFEIPNFSEVPDMFKPRSVKVVKNVETLNQEKSNHQKSKVMKETTKDFKQKIMLITPELAEQYLKKNTGNRPVKKENIRFMEAQLIAGAWKVAPDAIGFDWNDRLINGQHRLMACIETGIPFQANVMFGLDPDTYNITDTGIKRSLGDALGAIGVKNPMLKAAICKFVIEYKKGKSINVNSNSSNKLKLTNQYGRDFYEKNDKKVEAAATIGQYVYSGNHIFSASTIGGFAYIFSEIDEEDCKLFFEMFRLGEGLKKGYPVLTLRTVLLNDLSAKQKFPARTKYAMMIYAWNAYRTGKSLSRFTVSDKEFPKPI
jgi:hypothetical protein